jgi:glycosyltransferase involved in cell wall biosynthesis
MSVLPLVSICIPTFNRAEMVGKAIESALTQSYENIEVLVVDNASEDNIESVVAAYKDPRVKFFGNDKNLGIFGNFNRCIDLSKGKYIHILHSDDYIDSDFTKTCIGFMESHPSVGMTFTSSEFISEVGMKRVSLSDHDLIFPAPEGFRMILEKGNPVVCPSVIIKREVYELVGNYSNEYPYSADFYQWLKISRYFDIAYISNTTLYYRIGKHSESFKLLFVTPSGYLDDIKIFTRIIEELAGDGNLYRRELNIALRQHLSWYLYAGITRASSIKFFSPVIFVGFAFNMLTLIQPESFGERIKKSAAWIYLPCFAIAMTVPCGARITRKIFGWKTEYN